MAFASHAERLAFRYPFLSTSREFLQSRGAESISFESLQRASAFCRSMAEKSASTSFAHLVDSEPSGESLANYALSRLLLSQIRNPQGTGDFAQNFARLSIARLSFDAEKDESVFATVCGDFFPSLALAQKSPFDYSLSVFDYVKQGGNLLYAQLFGGEVFFRKPELSEFLEQAIRRRVCDLPRVDSKTVPEIVKDAAFELDEALPKKTFAPRGGGYSGKFLSLPCTSSALAEGVGEGKRYYGSMAVAIACTKDGLTKEQAQSVMQDYVQHCGRSAHEFSLREGLASLEWVYKHPSIGFSCKMIRVQGLAGSDDALCVQCPLSRGRFPDRK
ncbi:MAG: hypothetical protein WC792_05040 [Candidatus Micrarchaeia archaeon]